MVTFTHWGLNICPANEVVLYTGRAANARSMKDGVTNVFCLPDEPVHADGPLEHPQLMVNVIALKEDKKTPVPLLCAVCSVPRRPAVFVSIGRENECPPDWVAEYSGIIAANPKWPTDYICVNNAVSGVLLKQWDGDLVAVALDGNSNSKYPVYGGVSAVTCTVCTKNSIV